VDVLRQDLRLALRLLWKDRAFALTTILTLSLCIGANSAIFTVVRSVLLRPLPYAQSDRLVFMFDAFPGAVATANARNCKSRARAANASASAQATTPIPPTW
jgi:hypothetical protein